MGIKLAYYRNKQPKPRRGLTDTIIRTARPREKPYKMADEKGMFLCVTPTGGKLWRLKYRFDGKEKLL
jgi:hypothetical protein